MKIIEEANGDDLKIKFMILNIINHTKIMHKNDTISMQSDLEILVINICCTSAIQKKYSEVNS